MCMKASLPKSPPKITQFPHPLFQVKVWFQNRRTKHKREQQEQEQMQQSGGGKSGGGNSSSSSSGGGASSGNGGNSTSTANGGADGRSPYLVGGGGPVGPGGLQSHATDYSLNSYEEDMSDEEEIDCDS